MELVPPVPQFDPQAENAKRYSTGVVESDPVVDAQKPAKRTPVKRSRTSDNISGKIVGKGRANSALKGEALPPGLAKLESHEQQVRTAVSLPPGLGLFAMKSTTSISNQGKEE